MDDAKFDLQQRSIGKFEKLLDRLEMGAWEKLMEASGENLAPKKEGPKVSAPAFKEESP